MSDTAPVMTPQQLVAAVRGKDPMRGLCQSRQITSEGCDWLKFALDPFHDLQLDNMKGYPDVNTEPTVIVKIRQAAEISAPAGLVDNWPGSNWDCHIALSPIDWAKPTGVVTETGLGSAEGYNIAATVFPQGSTDSAQSYPAGFLRNVGGDPVTAVSPWVTGRLDGLMINSVPAGAPQGGDMTYTPGHCPKEAGNGYALNNIVLDNYLDFDETDLGVYRLVYSGFEVVNTTAQIYKQGACTVYEYGHSYETSQVSGAKDKTSADPSITTESFATNSFRCPPNTIAEAKIMPGAHSWPAQDGCYCTSKFLGENPFQSATMRNYFIQQNNEKSLRESGYVSAATGPTTYDYTDGSFVSPGLVGDAWPNVTGPPVGVYRTAYNAAPATHFSRMSTAGAYFTGLSPQTTLFVTWRVGIERLPAANKPTFLALAQPSATFDPNALLLYNLIANHLPPGCPQGWNDLGRWFNTVASIAKNVIPASFPLVSTAQMILHGMGAAKQAQSLPAAIQGVRQVAAMVRNNSIAGQRQVRAAQQIQAAARRRNPPPKQAVQNFGQPGGRRSRRVQQFSQMS